MVYNTNDKKLVVVLDAGTLPELGYICGPILHPSKIRIDLIQKLVSNRRTVYECNPENTNERVRLTLRNVRKIIFQGPSKTNKELIKTLKPELIQGKDANVNTEERLKSLIDNHPIQPTSENEEPIENSNKPDEQTNFEIESLSQGNSNEYIVDNGIEESLSETHDEVTALQENSEEFSDEESRSNNDDTSDESKEMNNNVNTNEGLNNRRKNRKNRK